MRQYLQKLEAYTRDRKRISELEIQIVVLRALGERPCPRALLALSVTQSASAWCIGLLLGTI